MKIILIAHGVFLNSSSVATGNSVRAYYLAKGLVDHGHQVTYTYPRELAKFTSNEIDNSLPGIRVTNFISKKELSRLIKNEQPDLLVVGYWELLDYLDETIAVPIVLDVVAPRILEIMFQTEFDLDAETMHMLTLYRRADRFLVGNERQRHFLLPWLIMAGIDCRFEIPIDIVPISSQPCQERPPKQKDSLWRFVSGGVSWPWRNSEAWFDKIVTTLENEQLYKSELCLFSGKYLYGNKGDNLSVEIEETHKKNVLRKHNLLAYGAMQQFLLHQSDIGIELADYNIEREYSQSFRIIEFMRAGLPVICNDYLEISSLIESYDAGWVVHSKDELPSLLQNILGDSSELERKSKNALRLIEEHFNYLQTIRPVIDYALKPNKIKRTLPISAIASRNAIPSSGNAYNLLARIRSTIKQNAISLLKRIFSKLRPRQGEQKEIVIITRSDIFPTDHGAAVKIDRTAAALSRYIDAVYLITDNRNEYYIYQQGDLIRKRFPLWISLLAPIRFFVRQATRKKGIPASDAFLYYPLFDWSYIIRTLYLAVRHPVYVFQAEFPMYARACIWARSLCGGKVLLVEHNVEYNRLREQIPEMSCHTVNYLRDIEIQLCNAADATIVVSERDRNQLIEDGVCNQHIHYIPHGVDLAQFDRAKPIDLRKRFEIGENETILVYHGTYLYPPNLEAMKILAQRILPMLHQRGVRVKVIAIGPGCPPQSLHEDIIFTGSVKSVAPYLLAANIAIVPLLKGGGTRMKILDYFAAALPVVSTAKGIEGIPVNNGVEAIIINAVDDAFVDAIINLIENPQQAAAMGKKGRTFVEQMDWSAIALRYLKLTCVK